MATPDHEVWLETGEIARHGDAVRESLCQGLGADSTGGPLRFLGRTRDQAHAAEERNDGAGVAQAQVAWAIQRAPVYDIVNAGPRNRYTANGVVVSNCKVYGGGAAKVAMTAGISLAEAEAFVDDYDRRLPFVRNTNRYAADMANERGWVRSLSGRKHRFEMWEPANYDLSRLARAEGWAPLPSAEAMRAMLRQRGERAAVKRYRAYKALNSVLQGGAADLMKEVLTRQAEAGLWDVLGPLLVTVHDEEGWSRPRTKEGRQATDEARDIFRQVGEDWNLRVPITTSREVGRSWGSVK